MGSLNEILQTWIHTDVFTPLLIFIARISDVSLGTVRMVFVARGMKGRAALLGFFEILIWISVIGYTLQHLTNITTYLAFAGGFAAGNFLGLKLEERLAYGLVSVTIITNRDASHLISQLKESTFGLAVVSARGLAGRVRMIISVVDRKCMSKLQDAVRLLHPNAFLSVQEVRSVSGVSVPIERRIPILFMWWRKGK